MRPRSQAVAHYQDDSFDGHAAGLLVHLGVFRRLLRLQSRLLRRRLRIRLRLGLGFRLLLLLLLGQLFSLPLLALAVVRATATAAAAALERQLLLLLRRRRRLSSASRFLAMNLASPRHLAGSSRSSPVEVSQKRTRPSSSRTITHTCRFSPFFAVCSRPQQT